MAYKIFDRVQETTTSKGTGPIVCGGAYKGGYRTFGSVLANNDTFEYCYVDPVANAWEVAVGTWNASGNSITRSAQVEANSNGNTTPLTLTGNTGVYVFLSVSSSTVIKMLQGLQVPIAQAGQLGGLIPDGSTILVDPNTGIATVPALYVDQLLQTALPNDDDIFHLQQGVGSLSTAKHIRFDDLAASILARAQAAVAPGKVQYVSVGNIDTSSINLTYSAANGTSPITYTGAVSPAGTNNFVTNNGTFSATAAQFIGLQPNTAYDLQIIATNRAGSTVTSVNNIKTSVQTGNVFPITFAGTAGSAPSGNAAFSNPDFKVDGNGNLVLPTAQYGLGYLVAPGLRGDGATDWTYAANSGRAVNLQKFVDGSNLFDFIIESSGRVSFYRVVGGQGNTVSSLNCGDLTNAKTIGLAISSGGTVFTIRVDGQNTSASWTDSSLSQAGYIAVGVQVPASPYTSFSKVDSTQVVALTSAPQATKMQVLVGVRGAKQNDTIPVAVTPVDGYWPSNQTVTFIATGVTGTFSPASVTAKNLFGALNATFTPTGAGPGVIDVTASGLSSVGGEQLTVQSPGATASAALHTITLTNWASVQSAVFHSCIVCFPQGAIKGGSSAIVKKSATTIASQFDDITTYPDGSWKFAVLTMRDDAGLPANTTGTYTVWSAPDVLPAALTGSINDAIAGHTFSAVFNNHQSSTDGQSFTTYGSGTSIARLADHAAISTRVERVRGGAVMDEWKTWGMVSDSSSGQADAHLKIYWYIRRWKNADGSTYAVQPCVLPGLDFWDIPGKSCRKYNALLLDASTTIASFNAVVHPYHSHWLFALDDQTFNRGMAPWVGGAIPTLFYQMDRTSWRPFMPDYNLTRARQPLSTGNSLRYVPGSSFDQRAVLDDTGAYDGRGVFPNTAVIAYTSPSASNNAVARINGLAELHHCMHYRSSRTRVRPQDTQIDVSSTPISPVMTVSDGSGAQFDFRGHGLPIPVNAYADSRTPQGLQDNFAPLQGGTGVWRMSNDGSHQVNYGGFAYLLGGDRYMYDACLDHAIGLSNCGIGNIYQNVPIVNGHAATASGPATTFYALSGAPPSQERSAPWAINITAFAGAFAPDNHEAGAMARRYMGQQAAYYEAIRQALLPSELASGCYPYGATGYTAVCAPWMSGFGTLTGYQAYRLTGDQRWLNWAIYSADLAINLINEAVWMTFAYRASFRPASDVPSSTNVAMKTPRWDTCYLVADNTGKVLNAADASEPSLNRHLDNGDALYVCLYDNNGVSDAKPPELQLATPYYIVNITNKGTVAPSFQLSTSPGGTPIVFSANEQIQTSGGPTAQIKQIAVAGDYNSHIPSADDYPTIKFAEIADAVRHNHPRATTTQKTAMNTFLGPVQGRDYWATWDYAV